jgi:hypothetical protein
VGGGRADNNGGRNVDNGNPVNVPRRGDNTAAPGNVPIGPVRVNDLNSPAQSMPQRPNIYRDANGINVRDAGNGPVSNPNAGRSPLPPATAVPEQPQRSNPNVPQQYQSNTNAGNYSNPRSGTDNTPANSSPTVVHNPSPNAGNIDYYRAPARDLYQQNTTNGGAYNNSGNTRYSTMPSRSNQAPVNNNNYQNNNNIDFLIYI